MNWEIFNISDELYPNTFSGNSSYEPRSHTMLLSLEIEESKLSR